MKQKLSPNAHYSQNSDKDFRPAIMNLQQELITDDNV